MKPIRSYSFRLLTPLSFLLGPVNTRFTHPKYDTSTPRIVYCSKTIFSEDLFSADI